MQALKSKQTNKLLKYRASWENANVQRITETGIK